MGRVVLEKAAVGRVGRMFCVWRVGWSGRWDVLELAPFWDQILHDMEVFISCISSAEGQTFTQIFGFYILNISFYVSDSLCSLSVHLSLMLPMAIQVPRLPLVRKKILQFQERQSSGKSNSWYLPNMTEDAPKSTQAAPKSIKDSIKTPAVTTSTWIRS